MYYFFNVVNNNIRWIMNKKEYKKIVEKNIEKEKIISIEEENRWVT